MKEESSGESLQVAVCSFIYQTSIACQLGARHWNIRDFLLGIHWASCILLMAFIKCDISIIISSKVFYISFSLASGHPTYAYIRPLEVLPKLTDALFIVLVFSVCFILMSFYCCVFMFIIFSSAVTHLWVSPSSAVLAQTL